MKKQMSGEILADVEIDIEKSAIELLKGEINVALRDEKNYAESAKEKEKEAHRCQAFSRAAALKRIALNQIIRNIEENSK